MGVRVLFTLSLLIAANCQNTQNNGGDLESIIKQIFGSGNQTNVNTGSSGQSGGLPPSSGSGSVGGQLPQATTLPPRPSTLVPTVTGSNLPKDTSCTTDKGEVGECVTYYQCNDNNTIIDDGVGLIDIRVRDGPCPSYMDTCCLMKRPTNDPITPAPPKPQEVKTGCGWRNPNGVGMRTTGDNDNEAKFGEFPWMVAILKIEPVNENQPDGQRLNVYVGGGSLIHPSVVLTAAHYVANPQQQLRVRAGEWDTQTTNEIYPYQDRDVSEVAVHQDFNKGNLFYDVAVLFLASPVDPAPNIGVACLPPPQERAKPGVRCYASGWGKDNFGKDGRYQVILKRVELPVVDRNTCQDRLRQTRLGKYFQLHSSFMCAGGEPGKDTCRGDGGSPLVCPIQYENERYIQNGIVAWGIGCGRDGTPGVYVDVSNVRTWIDDKVAAKGYDLSTYTYL